MSTRCDPEVVVHALDGLALDLALVAELYDFYPEGPDGPALAFDTGEPLAEPQPTREQGAAIERVMKAADAGMKARTERLEADIRAAGLRVWDVRRVPEYQLRPRSADACKAQQLLVSIRGHEARGGRQPADAAVPDRAIRETTAPANPSRPGPARASAGRISSGGARRLDI